MLHLAFMSLGCLYLLIGAVATWAALHYQLPAVWIFDRQPEHLATDIWWWGTRLSPPVPMLVGFAVALWLARLEAGQGRRAAYVVATLFGLGFSMGGAGESLLHAAEQPVERSAAALLFMLQAAILTLPPTFTALGILRLAKCNP